MKAIKVFLYSVFLSSAICALNLSAYAQKSGANDSIGDQGFSFQQGGQCASTRTTQLASPPGSIGGGGSSSCLTCRRAGVGYVEGDSGSSYPPPGTDASFDCDNPDEKAAAIEALLEFYSGDDPPSNWCTGICIFGSCVLDEVTTSLTDGCNFELHENSATGQCYYSMECGEGHKPKFSPGCGCYQVAV